ncbi:MAG: NAD(+)/NADH kinase [Candidatus Methanofastidiosia archaeon]|jgi:NAD+ kinase
MRIGLVSRTDKEEAIQVTQKIAESLSQHDLYVDTDLQQYIPGDSINSVDVLIVIGGDGTVLRTVHKYPFPVLSVKMGRRGHLCELNPDEIHIIPDILENPVMDKRVKLAVSNYGEALNEVVVRGEIPDKAAQFKIEYPGYTGIIEGDGIIVCTPTGSTAYSLAAGGPIIEKGCPTFCITPICPLDRVYNPRVISNELSIGIMVLDTPCHIALDGYNLSTLDEGKSIIVKKSSNYVEFWRKRK